MSLSTITPLWNRAILVLCFFQLLAVSSAWSQGGDLRALPEMIRPWLNEPALAERLDPTLSSRLARLYKKLIRPQEGSSAASVLAALISTACADFGSKTTQRRLLEVRQQALEDNWGLHFEAGARLDPDTGNVDSGGYTAYVGLSWEIYRDGLWDARLRANQYRLQQTLLEARRGRDALLANQGCRHSHLIAGFNGLKQPLLAEREELLQDLLSVYRQAYFLGYTNLDEVISLERDLERTRHTRAGLTHFNKGVGQLEQALATALKSEPPLPDVRIEKLITSIRTDSTYQTIAGLEREIVEQRWDERHYKRLRFYLHPRLRWNTDFNMGADVVAGVTFSMPLGERRDLERDAERALPIVHQTEVQAGDIDDVLRLYYEYKYRLDDAIKLHFQRTLILERLRRAFAENDLPITQRGSLSALLQGLRDLLDIQLEMLDVKQNLYARLLQLITRSGQGYLPEFVADVETIAEPLRLREGERSLYVWSEDFNRISNPLLLHLLKTKTFYGIVLSVGRKTDKNKLYEFLRLAEDARVRVELMASDNDWAQPGNADKAIERAQAIWAMGHHLHLDVEPHVFKDFRQRRASYIETFGLLLQRLAKAKKPGQTLSVALPTLLTEDEVRLLTADVDAVYVMAYGCDKPETVLQRLQPFRSIPAQRLVLVLRPRDFSSELALEQFIQTLVAHSSIRRFAIHDLSQFQTLIGGKP